MLLDAEIKNSGYNERNVFHWSSDHLWIGPLCRTAMSNSRVEGFVRPSLVFTVVKVSYILTTCPCFDNFEFDIFDAGGPQCHFITSVTTAVRIRTLSVCLFKVDLVFWNQSKPFNVQPSEICHSMCGLGQDNYILFGSVSHLGWTTINFVGCYLCYI